MRKRIQYIFENMQFKQKILVMFIAASMLLSILLSFGFYNRSVESIQKNYRKSMENSLTELTSSTRRQESLFPNIFSPVG